MDEWYLRQQQSDGICLSNSSLIPTRVIVFSIKAQLPEDEREEFHVKLSLKPNTSLSIFSSIFLVICLVVCSSFIISYSQFKDFGGEMGLDDAGLGEGPLPLTSMNHISLVCKSIEKSLEFYQSILGFFPIRRPGSFDFDGAWLFNYGIGIHLLQSEEPEKICNHREINPKDNHISFQCESMPLVEKKLTEIGINYIQRTVEEGGVYVDQLFFHDPDGFMIEICNCDNLPVIPLTGEPVQACSRTNFMKRQQKIQQQQQQQHMVQCLTPLHVKEDCLPCVQ